MSALINAILDTNNLGYAVKFKREAMHYRVTCIYKDNTSYSQTILEDHFNDSTVSQIIRKSKNNSKRRENYTIMINL